MKKWEEVLQAPDGIALQPVEQVDVPLESCSPWRAHAGASFLARSAAVERSTDMSRYFWQELWPMGDTFLLRKEEEVRERKY